MSKGPTVQVTDQASTIEASTPITTTLRAEG
jgi:hypothetical protein